MTRTNGYARKSKRPTGEQERWAKRFRRAIREIEIALSGLDRALVRGVVIYHILTILFGQK